MKNKSKTQEWPKDENTFSSDRSQITNSSLHKEYANEGDEFIDDAIRTKDQAFDQPDGTLEDWRIRSTRATNITN